MERTGPSRPSIDRSLEVRRLCLLLADGSRLDEVTLVLCGRGQTSTLWLEVDGPDRFVEQAEVTDVFEIPKRKVA